MKIIERKSAYPKRVICEKCASILEYDENDGEIRRPWGGRFIFRHMICPVCGYELSVSEFDYD